MSQSLAQLGLIAKDAPEVKGYRASWASRKLPEKIAQHPIYLKEGKEAKRRRVLRQAVLPYGGALGGTAAYIAATRGRGFTRGAGPGLKQQIRGMKVDPVEGMNALSAAGAGSIAGGYAAQRGNFKSGDVRMYNRKTGDREMPRYLSGQRLWREGETRG